MSNKRNRRRNGQRVRSEVNRKPVRVTKATSTVIDGQSAERRRKENARKPTKKEQRKRELEIRRWRVSGKPKKIRKPRTNYGRTFWRHSHDV